jgi:hypothetical protein
MIFPRIADYSLPFYANSEAMIQLALGRILGTPPRAVIYMSVKTLATSVAARLDLEVRQHVFWSETKPPPAVGSIAADA